MDSRLSIGKHNTWKAYKRNCDNEGEADRLWLQIKKLFEWRNRCGSNIYERREHKSAINLFPRRLKCNISPLL